MRAVLRWVVATIVTAAVLFIPVAIGTFAYYKTRRDPGWGAQPETFPILVMTDGRVNVVQKRELASVLAASPQSVFVVPNEQREAVQQQIAALRAEEGGKGKFVSIAADVRDRPDGSQDIHFTASQYDDIDNESWYVARPKSIEPRFHRYTLDLGVAVASVFTAVVIVSVAAPLLGLLIAVWRRRRGSATLSGP